MLVQHCINVLCLLGMYISCMFSVSVWIPNDIWLIQAIYGHLHLARGLQMGQKTIDQSKRHNSLALYVNLLWDGGHHLHQSGLQRMAEENWYPGAASTLEKVCLLIGRLYMAPHQVQSFGIIPFFILSLKSYHLCRVTSDGNVRQCYFSFCQWVITDVLYCFSLSYC